jgi:predicted transcriptional regulator
VSFDDYLDTPGVQRIVIALDKEGSMTFREFVQASTFDDRLAAKVRDAMAGWGLITVGWQNKKTQMIELTPLGKRFVTLTYKQAEIIEQGSGDENSA